MKKIIYILLWLIGGCGMFGLHRFYLGYRISGFIWLFSFGGLMIGAIYDILNIDKLIAESEGKEFKPKEKTHSKLKTKTKKIKNTSTNTQTSATQVSGVKIKYRIRGMQGGDIEEVLPIKNLEGARKMIKMKYVGEDVHICGTSYVY